MFGGKQQRPRAPQGVFPEPSGVERDAGVLCVSQVEGVVVAQCGRGGPPPVLESDPPRVGSFDTYFRGPPRASSVPGARVTAMTT